ncbi:MAG: acyl-CoA/acyl-ACP dehydrogenase, partial [Alphaproteobacteria bacterium]|nr:acyl-CoA/acyl-ACP dehydrogenase [Alphaproteobacteria bacterium]
MDLTLDPVQDLIQANARRFLSAELSSEKFREIEASANGFSQPLWDEIVALGWAGVALPEAYGGGGRGVLDLSILVEEAGRAVAPTPLVVSAGLAATILQSVPDAPVGKDLLIKMATEGAIISVAFIEESGRGERSAPSLQLRKVGDGFKITGEKILVSFASVATDIIVSVKSMDGEVALIVVNVAADGLTITRHKTIGGEPLFHVLFQDVAIAEDRILAKGDSAIAALNAGLEVAEILAVAEAVGLCEGIIKLTTEHVTLV